MFKELDIIALTTHISRDRIWDIPSGSPLRNAGNPVDGLRPGDVGTVVYVQGDGEALEVEFLEPDGYTVAIATVLTLAGSRLATKEDLANYRFWKKSPV